MSHTLIFRVVQDEGGETEVEPIEAEAGEELEEEAEDEVANPILPTANEMVWGAITFLLLWALMKWVLLPPIQQIQQARADKIRGDRDAAERATAEVGRLREEYRAGLASARSEATRVIDDARHAGEQRRAGVLAEAEEEVAAERSRAAAEVAAAKRAAMDDLKAGVAGLAVDAAQRVIDKPIDGAAQAPAIEEYVNEAGSPG